MLPNPLHPALVHFPIVLVTLLPIVAGVTLWAVSRGAKPRRAWLVPVALAAALAVSAWISVETGEQQEERVERVVTEAALDTHAEAAERFLLLSVGMVILAGVGLLENRAGKVARGATVVAALGLLGAGFQVGHSGGELVYKHGAAAAYVGTGADAGTLGEQEAAKGSDDDDDDRR